MTSDTPLDDRKSAILRALVSHYVTTGEPVGSKTLVERFKLGISPATARHEMGLLEEGGFIYQPHTSAGRIPTDVGYRHFVDSLTIGPRLSPGDARRIHRFFVEPRWEFEDALRQTASLLSALTDHAAVVFAPAVDRSIVRDLELVGLIAGRAMVVVVTDMGRVENHVVLVDDSLLQPDLDRAASALRRLVVGEELEASAKVIASSLQTLPEDLRELALKIAAGLAKETSQREAERVFLEGTSTMVDGGKFPDLETVKQVVGALEHRRVVLEVLAESLAAPSVSVRIGAENQSQEMQACSVVTAPYGTEDRTIGSLGVVGPTRMDYRRIIGAVREVAGNLGRMLTGKR
ncbi:MAG: heat-inducible transcriptional repressor [Actinomycetota bacterium]|jgi:heat-inducible transcriptional repressor|nr:heat-inducible transcriptional repressor [Actinomycetota bacterium]